MTEQQQHLSQLLQQRESLTTKITTDRETLLKVQGAIEYLSQIGVTLPQEPETPPEEEVESTEIEE